MADFEYDRDEKTSEDEKSNNDTEEECSESESEVSTDTGDEDNSDEYEDLISIPPCWLTLVNESTGRHEQEFKGLMSLYQNNGEAKANAEIRAYNKMLPIYKKELRNVLMDKLKWIHDLKKDPYYRKIMKTRQELLDTGDYSWKEATKAAINTRKFLLDDFFSPLDHVEQSEEDME